MDNITELKHKDTQLKQDDLNDSNLIDTLVGPIPEYELEKWKLVIHYMGPIKEYYKDPKINEIMINRYDSIFVEDYSGIRKTTSTFGSEDNLQLLIRQISIVLNQDNEKLQVLDARFPDQSRACCTMPSITPTGATITLRCAPKETLRFDDLIKFKSINQEIKEYLKERVLAKDNIIVSGSTGSGKTTILRALAEFIPEEDRVLCCEDTQELFLDIPNTIAMEAPKRVGSEHSLSSLIKTTLRQRPDRIFVGEIRDALACDAFLQVINTGHGGCATSIHANNPKDAMGRIQYLLTKEGLIDYELAGTEIKNSVNLFIQADKTKNGKRVTNISILDEEKNMKQIFTYDADFDIHRTLLS